MSRPFVPPSSLLCRRRRPCRLGALPVALLAFVWCVALVPLAPAQQKDLLCAACDTTGRVPVEFGRRWSEEHDPERHEVLYCSEVIREHETLGLPWEPCRRCKAPSLQAQAEQEWAVEEERLLSWLREREDVDRSTKSDDLVHVETRHFVIAWDIPSIKTDEKKVYKTHEAAHLYAERLEELYDKFQEMFGLVDDDFIVTKHYVYVFKKEAQQRLAGPIYTGLSGGPTLKRSGGSTSKSAIVTWFAKQDMPSEPDLRRNITHSVVHQLTAAAWNPKWFPPGETGLSPIWLNDEYGWLDAGLAHWFEWDLDGECTTYCFREQNTQSRWKGPDWRKNVYGAVQSGDVPSFAAVITKPTQALSAKEHQFTYAWVDFLISRDAKAVGDALRMCKQEHEVREILDEAWGISMLMFEDLWAEWVTAEYDPRK